LASAIRRAGRPCAVSVVAVEADQRGGRAGVSAGSLYNLEHRAEAVRAAKFRRAEKVAVGIGDQTALRQIVVRVEADQRGGRAGVAGRGLDNLEHRPFVVRAAERGRAEQVAVGIGGQTAFRTSAVEADQCG
jgi:hypothetical protein